MIKKDGQNIYWHTSHTGYNIDNEGAAVIVDALKHNNTLTSLNLEGTE